MPHVEPNQNWFWKRHSQHTPPSCNAQKVTVCSALMRISVGHGGRAKVRPGAIEMPAEFNRLDPTEATPHRRDGLSPTKCQQNSSDSNFSDPIESTPRTAFALKKAVSKARRILEDLAHRLKWRVAVSPLLSYPNFSRKGPSCASDRGMQTTGRQRAPSGGAGMPEN